MFAHALCWIHAERGINQLIPLNETHRKVVGWPGRGRRSGTCMQICKGYKEAPTEEAKAEISARFDEVCAV